MPPPAANPWYRHPVVLWGVSALAFILLILVLVSANVLPGLPPDKLDRAALSYSQAPSESKFTVSLQAPLNSVLADHPLSVTLLLANNGDKPIRFEEFYADPACPALALDASEGAIPTVFPHTNVAVSVRLVPKCSAATQQIALRYKAHIGDQPKGPPEFEGYLSSGPVLVSSRLREFGGHLFSLLTGLFRLIAIPGILALFGWWLNELVARRDQKLKEEQETRDQRLKREQEQRDRRNEVLNSLLSNYIELVQTHYLAISRRMGTVESELPEPLRAPAAGPIQPPLQEPGLTSLLSAILLLRARLLHLLNKKGGFYFRSKQAEVLEVDLLSGFLAEVWERLDKAQCEALVEMLNPDDTLTAAVQKLSTGLAGPAVPGQPQPTPEEVKQNQDRFSGTLTKFAAWLNHAPGEFRAYTRLLQIASRILVFECDRPFYQTVPVPAPGVPLANQEANSGWYFDPPTLILKSTMYDIPAQLQAPLFSKLNDYLDSVPPECRKSVDPVP